MSVPSRPLAGQSNGSSASTNRRALVRYQCAPATVGRVLLTDKQEWQRAWLLDLSQGGAGVLLGRQVEAGKHVVLQIKSASSSKTYELPARVAHATCRPDGEWVVGLELLTRLTPDELDALL